MLDIMSVAKMASLQDVTLELTHFSSLIPFMCANALLLWPSTFAQSDCPPGPASHNSNCSAAFLLPKLSAAVGALP